MTSNPATNTQWLDLAGQLQLERDLTDLPTLAELLERNYPALLARGDRDPLDSAIRYVARFDVLDLADRRTKWERSAHTSEPLTLADRDIAGPNIDPAWWADMARRVDARRQGILPTLTSWVGDFAGTIPPDSMHYPPTDPARMIWICWPDGTVAPTTGWEPTIARECHWLHSHLDTITTLQQAQEFAAEIRSIVADLNQAGLTLDPPDPHATATIPTLAAHTGIPAATIYRWASHGYLQPINNTRPRHYIRREVEGLARTLGR